MKIKTSNQKFTRRKSLVLFKLKESGISVTELCKKQKISRATFYNWMKALRLETLEKENKALKKELLRLRPRKKTSATRLELKVNSGSNEHELLEMVSTIIADLILSDNYSSIENFLKEIKSIQPSSNGFSNT
jgi:putative transposase